MPGKTPSRQEASSADRPPPDLHTVLMAQALDAYAAWLNSLADLGREQTQVGRKLIAEIDEIGRQHFAKASTRVTELMVVHTKLSGLWLERQPKTTKLTSPLPGARPAVYDRLVKRQNQTIAELRSAWGLPPQK